jgi:hypothetical protein
MTVGMFPSPQLWNSPHALLAAPTGSFHRHIHLSARSPSSSRVARARSTRLEVLTGRLLERSFA